MAYYNLQKPLQSLPPVLDNIITESIRKHLAGQWRYSHPRALTLQYVTEVFKIGVPPTDRAVLKLESGNVGATDNFIIGIHVA